MEALGKDPKDPSEKFRTEVIERIERFYPELSPVFGAPAFEAPPMEDLTSRIEQTSFKIFTDPVAYFQSERAKSYVSWSARRNDVYRVYFNTFAGKVYVDLNGRSREEIRDRAGNDALYREILRSLIFVVICEVEGYEAKRADEAPTVVEIP